MTPSRGHGARTRLLRFVLTVVAAASASCESPTGPGNGRIALGNVVDVTMSPGDSTRFFFAVVAGQQYVLFMQVQTGAAVVRIDDSTASVGFLPPGLVFPNGLSIDENPVRSFVAQHDAVYAVALSTYPADSAAQLRFRVYEVDDAPESRPAQFSFGDTVSGESLEPVQDVDVFTADGKANQDLVVAVELPGPASTQILALRVGDSTGNVTLGYAGAIRGATVTTGAVHLPYDGRYTFRFYSLQGDFHGPYRFWSYLISRQPEHIPAAAPLGAEVRGESIDRAGDIDEFTFSASAGTELNAFFQSAHPFGLLIAPQSGAALAAVSAGADTSLFAQASGRFVLTQGGTYVASVRGMGALSDTGAYRFYLYPIDRRPEHVSATIVPGDTVTGESIDLPGDIDEFTFAASAGQEFNAFLQAQGGSSQTLLQLEAVDADGTVLRSVGSTGADTSLLRQPTGNFAMRTSGTHRLRVMGQQTYGANMSVGPYRVFLYRVNRKPEAAPDTIAFGDSLATESLDAPGDIDEFRVHVADTSGSNLVIALGSGPTAYGSVQAQILDSASGRVIAGATSYTPGARGQSGAYQINPGSYIVRVQGGGTRGPYTLWLYRFSFGPESVRDTIAIGDTVSGESIGVPGDGDAFHFYGTRGQHVNIMIQGTGSSGGGGFVASLFAPSVPVLQMQIFTPSSAAALTDHQSLRYDLPTTGWYTLSVGSGTSPLTGLPDIGAYRFAVVPANTAPEHVGSVLMPGDSVTSEALDFPGDWDEYTVSGPPGSEMNIIFGTNGPCCVYPSAMAFNAETGDTLARAVGQDRRLGGPFKVPPSGTVHVAVFEYPSTYQRECGDATCNGIFRFTGAYMLAALAMNRAPETAPAAYTVGDTVRTEAVYPAGDIDEFTVTATPGDVMSAWWRLRSDPTPSGFLISLEVIDPANGAKLAGNGAFLVASLPQFISPGAFVVPASGHFIVRFRGSGDPGDDVGTAPYEFFVRRGP